MDIEDEPLASSYQFDTENIKVGDYILVGLKSKKGNPVHYIAIIKDIATEEFEVQFLKKTGVRDFLLTGKAASVSRTEVEMKLALPTVAGGMSRLVEWLTFGVDLSIYNLKWIFCQFFLTLLKLIL
jgi:hypothetical protein